MNDRPIRHAALLSALTAICAPLLSVQSFDAKYFSNLRWRSIGPLRGGRTRAGAGIADQPNVLYVGVVNGGVWKTNDFGRTWQPIFDDQPTGSIGAIAIAPSDPNIIYVGSGEGLQRPDLSVGDGIYKSTDAGKTWTHLGLRNGQQIPQLAVDPRNPNRVYAAVLGHPYGPNEERGIFRSSDGGRTFEKVLYKDENTGGSDVEIDPMHPDTIYAAMWEARQGPWENGAWNGTTGGIFKSTDGGTTWRQLTKGLPESGVIQANLAIAPGRSSRIFAAVATARGQAIYRTDDGGENWTLASDDARAAARIGGGDLPVPVVDPKNPDVVYSASVVTWKSTDAGKTWTALRGAPGGDDYQKIWINPSHPEILLICGDQGAVVSVNGGQTFSSWYNQATAQMYHVAADNAFPYRLCGGQQESGSACVASRGNDGEITFREWHPVGVEEYGYAAPDPLDPDIIYGGKLTRYDRRTGQTQNIAPKPLRPPDFRVNRTAPVMFSPIDKHTLFFASNTLWKTRDGGQTWQQISPDLTRKTWEIPATVGKYRGTPTAKPSQRGVIYALAPSPLEATRIWAGTDDGLIHVTMDGGLHWRDVTPPHLTPFAKVSILDASHFDAQTVYAAINTLRLDDMRPHILRTNDGGKTWTEIVNGIPDGAPVDVVREDPERKGLLYAGTETQVYVSFDDGDHWSSLRLNMPATSIRDLIVKGDDLAVATHGRGFWILDNITTLRQLSDAATTAPAFLFRPQTALRVRWNTNTDTPIPPDEGTAQNPPDGAMIDYYLGADAAGAVTLEISDAAGKLVRRYSSDDPAEQPDPMLAIPRYWPRPPRALENSPGMHRFVWDLHYAPVPGVRPAYPIAAVPYNTAPEPTSPWVLPGVYTAKLTAGGKTYAQKLTVKMDPRVHTPLPALTEQFTLSKQLYDDELACAEILAQARGLHPKLAQSKELDQKLTALEGASGGRGGGGRGGPAGPDTLNSVRAGLGNLQRLIQGADAAPTTQEAAAVADRRKAFTTLRARWTALQAELQAAHVN